ncbi:MAG: NAD(P)H-dependent oxidoreductase [Candidatus Falkowbacteria bacterium]
MNKPQIKVILGSIREGRAGIKVAEWYMKTVKNLDTADFELLDLKDYPLPLFADAELPGMRQGDHANPEVNRWLKKLESGDGFIFVTPEYNHSYTSVLKNAIDYAYKEWVGKPIGFVGYGGFAGGARAVEQLRLVAAELRMYSVRDQVVVPAVWAAFDQDGQLIGAEAHAKNALALTENVISLANKLRA